jgi:hypothetical protein
MTEQLFDLIQQNPRHRRDGLGPVDEVRRSLRHLPAVAGRGDDRAGNAARVETMSAPGRGRVQ